MKVNKNPSNNSVHLRTASEDDAELLFEWANDKDVRNNSFSTHQITHEEHMAWFGQLLANKDARQYILMTGNEAVGQIRVNIEDDSARISYSIASDYRRMGYGKLIISLLPDVIRTDFPDVKKLIAEVKPNNIGSRKAFIDNQFTEKNVVYELELVTDK